MIFRFALFSLLALVVMPAISLAQKPIKPIEPLALKQYKDGEVRLIPLRKEQRSMPVAIHSAKEARKWLNDALMTTPIDSIDWEQQHIVAFVWKGRESDRQSFHWDKNHPTQVTFTYLRGTQGTLVDFNHIYVLRNDVTWRYHELSIRPRLHHNRYGAGK